MVARWTPYLRILVGVVLLSTPALWQPGADYATERYEASEIEYTDDSLRPESGALTGPIRGLSCYVADDSRYCSLERYVAQQGPITVARGEYAISRSEFVATGGFYRPVDNRSDDNVTLDLEPVEPETVLRELSRPTSELSEPAREALRTDESVTDRVPVERAAGRERHRAQFVAHNDSYYLLQSQSTVHGGVDSPLETPVKAVLFALGLWFVLRGQARRTDLDDPPF